MNVVLLVVIVLNGSGNGSFPRYFKMNSMEECLKSVELSVTNIAKGGDAEQGVVIFCSNGKDEQK